MMPARADTSAALREVLGDDAYATLVRHFGGRRIRVPPAAADSREELRARVLAEFRCGCGDPEHHSYRAVARRLGVTVSTVYRYASRV